VVVELVVLEVLDQMGTLTAAAKAAAQGMSIMLADEAAQVHLAVVATVSAPLPMALAFPITSVPPWTVVPPV
jgi:hypothetical protein